MKRALALVAAAGLVLGAVLVRRAVDSDDDGGGGNGLVVVCDPALAAVCDRLAADGDGLRTLVEDAPATASRLSAGRLRLDDAAWLTAAPWPAMAAASADGEGDGFPDLAGSTVVAASPAVLVALRDRMEAIDATCGTPTWACIGERAGGPWTDLGGRSSWGPVKVALPDAGSGAGAVAVNQAVASRVGRTDFAINDLDDDSAAAAWFDRLASESSANQRAGRTPLQQFLQVPASLGVVGALGAEADTALARVANADSYRTVVPEPRATAQVRLWSADAGSLSEAIDRIGPQRLASSLADAGWEVTGEVGAVGAGTTVSQDSGPYPDAGLPRAGVMSAVITRWENVR